jgi:hypothetical protein
VFLSTLSLGARSPKDLLPTRGVRLGFDLLAPSVPIRRMQEADGEEVKETEDTDERQKLEHDF